MVNSSSMFAHQACLRCGSIAETEALVRKGEGVNSVSDDLASPVSNISKRLKNKRCIKTRKYTSTLSTRSSDGMAWHGMAWAVVAVVGLVVVPSICEGGQARSLSSQEKIRRLQHFTGKYLTPTLTPTDICPRPT